MTVRKRSAPVDGSLTGSSEEAKKIKQTLRIQRITRLPSSPTPFLSVGAATTSNPASVDPHAFPWFFDFQVAGGLMEGLFRKIRRLNLRERDHKAFLSAIQGRLASSEADVTFVQAEAEAERRRFSERLRRQRADAEAAEIEMVALRGLVLVACKEATTLAAVVAPDQHLLSTGNSTSALTRAISAYLQVASNTRPFFARRVVSSRAS